MKRNRTFSKLSIVAFMIVVGLTILVYGEPTSEHRVGVPDDWSHHHLVFSNPGTFAEAMKNGTFLEWYKMVNDPRFQIQQMKRHAEATPGMAEPEDFAKGTSIQQWVPTLPVIGRPIDPSKPKPGPPPPPPPPPGPLHRDWSESLGGAGVAPGMSPAKWTFSPIAAASCSDYVVYGVNTAGASGTQANLVGLTNLYVTGGTGICGSAPTFLFSYYVGIGTVQTSPALSTDGTKVAYVESISGGSKFHVLTIGTTGSNNGTSATSPVLPATTYLNGTKTTNNTLNNAVDYAITMSGSVSVTRSSVFVDYGHDVAYVGDDGGKLHKFYPVFSAAPQEVTASWPVQLKHSTTNALILTGPVYDSVSGNVYVGDSAGYLYSVNSSGTVTASGQLGAGTGVVDAPVVDIIANTVYVFLGDNAGGTESAVVQLSIPISSGATGTAANVGTLSATVPLYAGVFDNTYYSSASGKAGYLYVCGNAGGSPTLYPIPITGTGTMGTVGTGVLLANNTGTECSPLAEIYNTGTSTDWLFVSVGNNSCGAGTGAGGCTMSFNVTSGPPTIGPWLPNWEPGSTSTEVVDTAGNIQQCSHKCTNDTGSTTPSWTTGTTSDGSDVRWTYQSASNGQTTAIQATGSSGIVIDNVSTSVGASSLYFGTLSGTGATNSAVKMTQAGLQ
jgi:hypothetical protein